MEFIAANEKQPIVRADDMNKIPGYALIVAIAVWKKYASL